MALGTARQCGCPEAGCPSDSPFACGKETVCYPYAFPGSVGCGELVWLCSDCYGWACINHPDNECHDFPDPWQQRGRAPL
jgi:hypothetical protein